MTITTYDRTKEQNVQLGIFAGDKDETPNEEDGKLLRLFCETIKVIFKGTALTEISFNISYMKIPYMYMKCIYGIVTF